MLAEGWLVKIIRSGGVAAASIAIGGWLIMCLFFGRVNDLKGDDIPGKVTRMAVPDSCC